MVFFDDPFLRGIYFILRDLTGMAFAPRFFMPAFIALVGILGAVLFVAMFTP